MRARLPEPVRAGVATILSAQCTDERVNLVTPALFARYPERRGPGGGRSLPNSRGSSAPPASSAPRRGASSAVPAALVARPRRRGAPQTIDVMRKLPGVGRKTANVVLGHAFGIAEGIAVDTHVLRVTNRLGLAAGRRSRRGRGAAHGPRAARRWTRTTDLLIFHGRKICDARRPRCGECPLFALCRWPTGSAWARLRAKRPRPGASHPRARQLALTSRLPGYTWGL